MKLETFFESFGQLADAPNGVQKLRELILQLAVQGTLTQNWRGENAISKDEKWRTVEFFDFCVLQRGYDLPLANQEVGPFPIVTSAGIAGHHSVFKAIAPGVIVGRSGSIGKVFYIEENFWPHNTTLYVKDFKGNFPRYVYYYLLGFKAQQFSRSTAVPTLNRNHLRGQLVEAPPYEEQERIVIQIEKLMALCDELEARQQRQQTARVRLNNAALEGLLTASAPAEFDEHWQRICDNFDLLYDAPATVTAFRQAILQLAVQGKLVPQDANDEPAGVLLAKIKAEKERLIQEKRIKNIEPLPPIKPDEVPFDLPQGWEWVRVIDSYDVVGGIQKTPQRKPVSNIYPYLRVANVYRGRLVLDEIENFELFDGELDRWKLRAGDLLVVEGNGSESEIGRCAIWNGEIENCVHQNHLIRCRPIETDLVPFNLLFLNSPSGVTEMKRLAITTSGLYSLSVGKIRSIVIPLPPLAEQRRIVAKIDQLMALCEELEAKLRQAQLASAKLVTATVQHLASA